MPAAAETEAARHGTRGLVSKLRRRGLKITPARDAILRTLGASSSPMDGFALTRACRAHSPTLRTDTMYRFLRELTRAGYLRRDKPEHGRSVWSRKNS